MTLSRLARRLDLPSRRDFLARAAGLLGVSLLAPAFAGDPAVATPGLLRRPTAKKAIYLYMAGGMSHLDTFDLKPGSPVQGPVEAIATRADGIRISQHLPLLAQQMHHVAVINSLTSTQGAHEQGQYFVHTSYAPRATITHPALGAWLSSESPRLNARLPPNVVIGGASRHPGAGFLEPRHAPLPIGDAKAGLQHSTRPAGVDAARAERRLSAAEALNAEFRQRYANPSVTAYHQLYAEALALMQSEDLAAFDITQEPAELSESYGDTSFGRGCLLARRLVEHDVRFVEVQLGGWDTHVDNHERVAEQCAELDAALATLLGDLHRRGLLEETLVVLATEFGRTPDFNPNDGRDHHPAVFTGLLAGGGVKGGQRHGASDERGHRVAQSPVTIPDFNATIAYALGLPIAKTITAANGRPFTIADKGRPVTAVF